LQSACSCSIFALSVIPTYPTKAYRQAIWCALHVLYVECELPYYTCNVMLLASWLNMVLGRPKVEAYGKASGAKYLVTSPSSDSEFA